MAVSNEARRRLGGRFRVPCWRQCFLSRQKATPALDVVAIPKKELERLGIVLNVEEIVHEVAQRTWLGRNVSPSTKSYHLPCSAVQLTGAVRFLMTCSKHSSSGILHRNGRACPGVSIESRSDIASRSLPWGVLMMMKSQWTDR
jgi:hypothetical protein